MTRVDLPYLWLRTARGKQAAYYRRGGLVRRIRALDGAPLLPGQAGFLAAYQALHSAAAVPERAASPPRSLAALCAAYRASDEWRDLAPATRADYGRMLDALVEAFGSKSVPDMPRSAVFAVRTRFATDHDGKPTPRRANKATAVLRLLLTWAVDRGWRKDNPALRPGQLRTGPGYPTWTARDFTAFMASDAVGEPLKRAVALGYYTGLRLSDALALPRSARRGGVIETIPTKTARTTGARVAIPEHPDLARVLDAAPPASAVTLLTRADGMPWKADHFKHALADAVARAGLAPGLSFHGLRKGLTAALAERGATDAEIDAVIPHADGRMTRHYRRQADQATLARTAIGRLRGTKREP